MDPDQTAPTGTVWSGYTRFVYEASNILVDNKNIHFVIISLYTVRIFIKCMHVCAAQTTLLIFLQIINRTRFPLLSRWNSRTTPRYEYQKYRLYREKKSSIIRLHVKRMIFRRCDNLNKKKQKKKNLVNWLRKYWHSYNMTDVNPCKPGVLLWGKSKQSSYNLRNAHNIRTIHSRTTQYFNSSLPSNIREWKHYPLMCEIGIL